MKLALDVGPLKPQPAGVGIYTRSLANAIAVQPGDDELAFVGRRPDARGLPDRVESVWRSARLPYSAWALLRAGAVARAIKPDVLLMTDGLVPLVMRPPRVVLTVLDMTLVERPRDHRVRRYARIPFLLASPRFAAEVIVPSRATAEAVVRLTKTPARRVHVIPLAARPGMAPSGADTVRGALERHGLAGIPYILVPGTIEPRKNPIGSLRAFEAIASEPTTDPATRLVYLGSPGWRSANFVAAISESPHRHRVSMLGYVEDGDVGPLMQGARLVLYPSFSEGFGLPVLEAMANGAIVVTSDRSSLPEVAGDAAVLINPDRVDAIADALRRILTLSDAERTSMAEASIARSRTFSWESTAASVLAICRSATRPPGR
jgi:glycosyltransferase involved in cell wall biosynthesis